MRFAFCLMTWVSSIVADMILSINLRKILSGNLRRKQLMFFVYPESCQMEITCNIWKLAGWLVYWGFNALGIFSCFSKC